jgi:hypothetical protein
MMITPRKKEEEVVCCFRTGIWIAETLGHLGVGEVKHEPEYPALSLHDHILRL